MEYIDEINALVDAIKEDPRYSNFLEAKKLLETDEIQILLNQYQDALHEYEEMKKYEQYQDMSYYKDKVLEYRKEISENDNIQRYYQAYYDLNHLLDHISEIVFKDISDELNIGRFGL